MGAEIVSIRTISSRQVYANRWTRVREDVIERNNGERGIYGVVDKDPCCVIVPVESTAEGEFIWLVEQFRYTVGKRFKELPQGGWEEAEVDPRALAAGELREETGLRAERLTELGVLQIGYGVMNQKQHVFLAERLTEGAHDRDREEHDLEVFRVSVGQFEQMIVDGEIVDNCSLAAWGLYRLWREREEKKGIGRGKGI